MRTHSFKASDDKKITYYSWEVKNPKAVFQIVHGSIEWATRYNEFATALNKAGFSVFAMDIRGHGETGKDHLGHIADANGAELVLEDVNHLNNIIKAKHPESKIVLLGHSMGSFIARAYVTRYQDVDTLIAIGTNHKPKATINMLKWISASKSVKNGDQPGKMLHNMSYKAFDSKFKRQGKLAWLSLSKKNRTAYQKSKWTKFIMTNKSFYEFSRWMTMFTNKKQASQMKGSTRVLLLNGTDDPVGSMGREVTKANKFYTKLGYYSEQIEYRDLRHEILNEETRELVYHDIINFVSLHSSSIDEKKAK